MIKNKSPSLKVCELKCSQPHPPPTRGPPPSPPPPPFSTQGPFVGVALRCCGRGPDPQPIRPQGPCRGYWWDRTGRGREVVCVGEGGGVCLNSKVTSGPIHDLSGPGEVGLMWGWGDNSSGVWVVGGGVVAQKRPAS